MEKKKNNYMIPILFLGLIIILTAISFRFDTDIMWHFKTGEWIVNHGKIPSGDVFSWHENLSWMCHEWLYDIGLYLIYDNLGIIGARVLLFIAFSLPVIISYFYNRKKIKYNSLYFLYMTYVMYFMFIRDSSDCARPSEFSILIFLFLTIVITENYKYKHIITFLSTILYVNIHGGSIMQILLIPILCILSDLISGLINKKIYKDEIIDHIILLLNMILAMAINPYGFRIIKYTTDNFFSAKEINSNISEWSYSILTIEKAICMAGVFLCIGSSEKFKKTDHIAFRQIILMCAFFCQGITIRRMMFPFECLLLLYGYGYVEEYFCKIFNTIKSNEILLEKVNNIIHTLKFDRIPKILTISIKYATTLVVIGISVIYLTNAGKVENYVEAVNESNEDIYEVIKVLKENNVNDNIFTGYNIGGFLILNDLPTFVDPRCDPFMEKFSNVTYLTDYMHFSNGKEGSSGKSWEKLNKDFNFEYAIFDKIPFLTGVVDYLKYEDKIDEVLVDNDTYYLLKLRKETNAK